MDPPIDSRMDPLWTHVLSPPGVQSVFGADDTWLIVVVDIEVGIVGVAEVGTAVGERMFLPLLLGWQLLGWQLLV